jgi:hypothetical protein
LGDRPGPLAVVRGTANVRSRGASFLHALEFKPEPPEPPILVIRSSTGHRLRR